AVHLDRGANEALALNPQEHLRPLWGIGTEPGDFRGYLAGALGVDAADVMAWDVMTHDLQPSRRIGRDLDLIAAPRLDNLATSYAGGGALIGAAEAMAGTGRRWPRRLPSGAGRDRGGRWGHGARNPPELPREARTPASDRDQRWPGAQDQRQTALRDGLRWRGGVHHGLRPGGRA